MTDFYEIDFLSVASKRSGDAITVRYEVNNQTFVHVIDGGFQATGASVVEHIKTYYPGTAHIDHVVATHPDGDHAGGLRAVLEEFTVGTLWILRPWLYSGEIIHRFARFTNTANLEARLKEVYPNIAALEEIALERSIPMEEPFQGAVVGQFTVVSPSKEHYLDMVVESDKTPEISKIEEEDRQEELGLLDLLKAAVNFVAGLWGEEIFSTEDTSAENEMSVVQYAYLCQDKVLLTADAGRKAMNMAADFAIAGGVSLPGLDKFQVPHHGSRRNVSSEILDRWLGSKLAAKLEYGTFDAYISASKEDKDHPRKAVVRACIHRGANVLTTENGGIQTGRNYPQRQGWTALAPHPYPPDQES